MAGAKEFRCNNYGDQNEKEDGLKGMICKMLSQQSATNFDIDMFDGNLLEFNCSCQYLRRWQRVRLSK